MAPAALAKQQSALERQQSILSNLDVVGSINSNQGTERPQNVKLVTKWGVAFVVTPRVCEAGEEALNSYRVLRYAGGGGGGGDKGGGCGVREGKRGGEEAMGGRRGSPEGSGGLQGFEAGSRGDEPYIALGPPTNMAAQPEAESRGHGAGTNHAATTQDRGEEQQQAATGVKAHQ
ncbi:hypothetical protein KFL_011690010 [Klebsormidium nitens]|uniref:Uncharacterized protein n=1 Tax=Klebsormidium nitens TaxID=105231 RepID=A0A1Y1IQA6_KLENI|nr:hypothetical protein KFL_011690010 [Klebsormidium nitens]|eukprot:GAQ92853.1 hypothetical protein KFL_011690010 [Klebsormidium nitens]